MNVIAKTKKVNYVIALACMLLLMPITGKPVTVTLLTDEGMERTNAIATAERNLAAVLTEINRAQAAKTILTTKVMPMNDFAVKSLIRIWAVTPFYCDDDEVVDRLWVFKDGTMMANHVPLIITPEEEDFGVGTYQEAVIEFDKHGNVTDFRFGLDAQMSESMGKCGSVVEREKQMIIKQYIERFRTAYNQKDISTIEQMFSDDALIITGKVVTTKASEMAPAQSKVEYVKQNKRQYISNLRKAFLRNKWINVKFDILADDTDNGCPGITRSKIDPTRYGVRMRQEWNSSSYSDEGYLFLLWEFPEDGRDPIIHVRTWQPEKVGGEIQQPDNSISTLGGFDL